MTAHTLYEPTLDLITGHRNGMVVLYGRNPDAATPSSFSSSISSSRNSHQEQQRSAATPLMLRPSHHPVTALHCVPLAELEAASMAPGLGCTGGSASFTSVSAAMSARYPPHFADSASSMMRTPSLARQLSTLDDVLLFTGDANGRVLAVRYSRVVTEVMSAAVFTVDRTSSGGGGAALGLGGGGGGGGGSTLLGGAPQPVVNPKEINGLHYRDGYLVISTAAGVLTALRVLDATLADAEAGVGGMPGSGEQGMPGGGGGGGGAGGGGGVRPPPLTIPDNATYVTLLSPASAAAAAAAAAAGGQRPPLPAAGTMRLKTVMLEGCTYAKFGALTAMVSLDWSRQAAGGGGAAGEDAARAGGPAGVGGSVFELSGAISVPGVGGAPPGGGFFASGNYIGGASLSEWGRSVTGQRGGAGGGGEAWPAGALVRRGPWRLLTAHDKGQMLLWDVSHGKLQLMCMIGDPGPAIT